MALARVEVDELFIVNGRAGYIAGRACCNVRTTQTPHVRSVRI